MVLTGALSERLRRKRPLLLDGAVGTALSLRGVPTGLPLWSAHALTTDSGMAVLRSIHAEYAQAGAEVLVTNTFRTTRRVLEATGYGREWRELNHRAVQCARDGAQAAAQPRLVAGGLAPLEDCYRPDLVPAEPVCFDEHVRQAELLAREGVDLLIVETLNSVAEARAAARAASETGLDVLISFCPGAGSALLSGEPLSDAIAQVVDAGGDSLRGLLLNCAPPEVLEGAFADFARFAPELPHGVYAHLGEPLGDGGWRLPQRHDPAGYADWVLARVAEGARIVGGCCGTTPGHIARIHERLRAGFD